jgi:hypothetical protein
MKKGWFAFGVIALALVMASPATAAGVEVEVRLAPLGRTYAPPRLGSKQGWLSISNRDWKDYTFVENKKGRATLYEGGINYPGSIVIPSGSTITIALEKDTWDIMGNTNDRLKVKVREGRTSTVSLEPFGYKGNTGLRGISNDGDRVRDEILFNVYVQPPVVIQPPPAIIIDRPPPPPVIIQRPPVVVVPPYHHRPPPPPPHYHHSGRPHHGDSWGFSFGFSSGR